ncbi:amidohydrolase family protein [Anaerovoracaceae bacterium 41-7]
MKTLVLKNCRLIPYLTEGFVVQENQLADVVIEDKRIKTILPAGTAFEGDVDILDVKGDTLMPGMLDLHMHFDFTTMDVLQIKYRSAVKELVEGIEYGFDYLRSGYTTVRDCGSAFNLGVTLRDMYAKGTIMGPRVIASGHCNTPTAPGNTEFGPLYKVFDDVADARKIVREDIEAGCDFVKYMATGAVMNIGGDPGAMICSFEELKALSDAAKEQGTYVAAHCHGKKGIMACAEAEIGSIEHASYIDDACIETLLAHGNQTFIVPTVEIAYSMLKDLTGNTPAFMHERSIEIMEHISEYMTKAYRAGIRLGWGTDADRVTFNEFPGLEFIARKAAGFSNEELLKMATVDSAALVGLQESIGTVKEGKLADLIVMEGEPDINIEDMKKLPKYVFKEGKLFVE